MKHLPLTMPLIDHITELRRRILFTLTLFVLAMIAALFLSPELLNYLKSVPPATAITWNVFSPWDALRMYMSIAFVIAAAITLPFALYQLWLFVKHGLSKEEQSATLRYIPYSVISFLTGLSFAYFVVFPMSFSFTSRIAHSMNLVETYGIAQYFGFMLSIVLPLAVAFELPIIVMFLTRIGLLNPRGLSRMRRFAYVILVVVASLISPPEFISHLMVFVPLVLLYEISVVLSRVVYNRRAKTMNLNLDHTAPTSS
ncbi:twin-arginine translocase subunit TatC [Paenibacillus sp. GCM10023252]|uniref:twin-arginine translocase subunit TatC n=1 Tax=Paenibacillus sp. GCM10023252 TaxID=3252649 RepID=UPI00360A9A7C